MDLASLNPARYSATVLTDQQKCGYAIQFKQYVGIHI